jgi:hypothetical protein
VGSAVNDTTRELGGAFGVAVLGSIVSSTYGPQVRDAVGTSLPADSVAQASDQVGAAMEIAARLPTGPSQLLHDAAATAFVDGMSTALTVGAAALVLGSIVAALFLPARAQGQDDDDRDRDAGAGPLGGDTDPREPALSTA